MHTKFRMNQLAFLVAGTLFSIACLSPKLPAAERPNVLFIAVDDLNDWIGCMKGHPQALTPNMDRLASRGVLFTNAHCAAPACNPSRAAVFSGLMPSVTHVWSNQSASIDKLYPQAKPIPASFKDAGYLTLGTGKLLHKGGKSDFADFFNVGQRWSPLDGKTNYTREELPSKGTENPRHETTDSKGRKVILPLNRMPSDRAPDAVKGESFDWGGFDVPDSDFGDTQITNWAIDKIESGFEKPVFLAVGYYRPHIPLWAPQRFFDRFKQTPAQLPVITKDDLDDLSEAGKKWAIEAVTAGSHATVLEHDQWRQAVEAYLACVTYVDHEIGRLLNALDQSEIADNTLIVMWSDHGWHLGEKEHWGKWTGWERSTKVPLIIAPPKDQSGQYAKAGSICSQPVGLIDLYPTLADVCQIKAPGDLHGQSLVALLKSPDTQTDRAVVTTFDKGNVSVGTQHWRFVQYADGSRELYDHRSDPHEWKNLAGNPEYAAFEKRLVAMIEN